MDANANLKLAYQVSSRIFKTVDVCQFAHLIRHGMQNSIDVRALLMLSANQTIIGMRIYASARRNAIQSVLLTKSGILNSQSALA